MKKPFLLIVNDQYYPSHGVGDWIRCYDDEFDAINEGRRLCSQDEQKSFEVVDLRNWA